MAREVEATFDALLKKKRREDVVEIKSVGDDGEDLTLLFRMRAIGSRDYDDLVAKYPPTSEQKKQGAIYDHDRFGPALISAVAVSPSLTIDEARQLWNSEDWAGGEVGALFLGALRLCNAGLDVPFNAAG